MSISFGARLSRLEISHPLNISLSLSLSRSLSFSPRTSHALPPSLSPSLSLSRSLGGHVWNHLVSQETWQNDEEDTCNVRSAKRGERRGEGEEKIDQACKLKSSAQKVSQHRLRDFNLEAQIVPKCLPKGPSETLWTHLGTVSYTHLTLPTKRIV